jgi:hypothetical protein
MPGGGGAVSTERFSWLEAKQHQTRRFEMRFVLRCDKMTSNEASEFEQIDCGSANHLNWSFRKAYMCFSERLESR